MHVRRPASALLTATLALAAAVAVPPTGNAAGAPAPELVTTIALGPEVATVPEASRRVSAAGGDGTLYVGITPLRVAVIEPDSDRVDRIVTLPCPDPPLTGGRDGALWLVCPPSAVTAPNRLLVVPAGGTVARSVPQVDEAGLSVDAVVPAPDGDLALRAGRDVWRLRRHAATVQRDVTLDQNEDLVAVDGDDHTWVFRRGRVVDGRIERSTVAVHEAGVAAPVRVVELPANPGIGAPERQVLDRLVGRISDAGTLFYLDGSRLWRREAGSAAGEWVSDTGIKDFQVSPAGKLAYLRGSTLVVREIGGSTRLVPVRPSPDLRIPTLLALEPSGAVRLHTSFGAPGIVETVTGRTTTAAPGTPLPLVGCDETGGPSVRVVPGPSPADTRFGVTVTNPRTGTGPTTYDRPLGSMFEFHFSFDDDLLNRPVEVTAWARGPDGRVTVSRPVTAVLRRQCRGSNGPVALALGRGVAFHEDLAGEPGGPPARITSGALPAGVVLDPDGVVRGTPTRSGTFHAVAELPTPALRPWGVPAAVPVEVNAEVRDVRHSIDVGTTWVSDSTPWVDIPWTVRSSLRADPELADVRVFARIVSATGHFWDHTRAITSVAAGSSTSIITDDTSPLILELRTHTSDPVLVVVRRRATPGADVWVRLAGAPRIPSGGEAELTLRAGNAGTAFAPDVTGLVQLPEGASVVRTTCGGTPIGSRLLLTAGGLRPNQVVTCRIMVRAPTAPVGTTGRVVAGVASLAHDPLTLDNTTSLTLVVVPAVGGPTPTGDHA